MFIGYLYVFFKSYLKLEGQTTSYNIRMVSWHWIVVMKSIIPLLSEIPFWNHIKRSQSQGYYKNMRWTLVTYLKDFRHNTIIIKNFETKTERQGYFHT